MVLDKAKKICYTLATDSVRAYDYSQYVYVNLSGNDNPPDANATAIAIDSAGDLHVTSSVGLSKWHFDPPILPATVGTFTKVQTIWTGDGASPAPRGVKIDAHDNIYVLRTDGILAFSMDGSGNYVRGLHAGYFPNPTSLTTTECQSPAGDLNGDCAVDFADFSELAANWLNSGVGDINTDGIADYKDLNMMCQNWLTKN
jgi:hypothetical protein